MRKTLRDRIRDRIIRTIYPSMSSYVSLEVVLVDLRVLTNPWSQYLQSIEKFDSQSTLELANAEHCPRLLVLLCPWQASSKARRYLE